MRESIAHALVGLSSLQSDDYRERPVDRLHALASAQINQAVRSGKLSSLGVSLIALKNANRPDEYPRAVDRLAKLLCHAKMKANEQTRTLIAMQAVQEYVIDFCPTCKGSGEIPDKDGLEGAQRMKTCPECGGHGKRRYSDPERVEALRLNLHDTQRWMAHAMSVISEAESEAYRTAHRLLEHL